MELSRVASGTFGSVVKVSQHSLMVGGTVYVRANIYLTFQWLFIVHLKCTFFSDISTPGSRVAAYTFKRSSARAAVLKPRHDMYLRPL